MVAANSPAASFAVCTAFTFLQLVFLLEKLVHKHSLLIFLSPLFVIYERVLVAPNKIFVLLLALFVPLDARHVLLLAHVNVLWIQRLVDLGGSLRFLEQLVGLWLDVDESFLVVYLLRQALKIIHQLEVAILVIELLVLGHTAQMRDANLG